MSDMAIGLFAGLLFSALVLGFAANIRLTRAGVPSVWEKTDNEVSCILPSPEQGR